MDSTITELLKAASDGDTDALDDLWPYVYDELRALARSVRFDDAEPTLDTTGLVHETYLKLVPSATLDWEDRRHFFRVAARAMRQVLVSAAQRRNAQKRGGPKPDLSFDDRLYDGDQATADLLALDDALDRLARRSERQARVVECRFFVGLTVKETARVLDVSESTVYRDWRVARAWLAAQLEE